MYQILFQCFININSKKKSTQLRKSNNTLSEERNRQVWRLKKKYRKYNFLKGSLTSVFKTNIMKTTGKNTKFL